MAVNQFIIFVNILVGGYGNLAGISADSIATNSAYRVTAIDKVKSLCAMRSDIGNTGDFYIAVKQVAKGVRTRRDGSSGLRAIRNRLRQIRWLTALWWEAWPVMSNSGISTAGKHLSV